MKAAIKGGKSTPQDASLIIVYTLARALAISPLEVYKMPAPLVQDLLSVHFVMEEIKYDEMQKSLKSVK